MSTPEEFANEIEAVKESVPDADENKIAEEFRRYRDEFLIPPKEALRSVLKKFQSEAGMEVTEPSSNYSPKPSSISADRFNDLGPDDSNVTIEVQIITYTPRMQMVRGEERQIAFGWIEDNPWEDGGERTRWDFKDWGNHAESLAPGSVVRLEGVSVNEWNGKRSININQSSRVAVLRASDREVVIASSDPTPIDRVINMDGFATVVARLISIRNQPISRKDGTSGEIIKGRLADETGSIGFVSWGEFDYPIGTLLKVENASIRRFRDNPELNIGDRTKVEIFHDGGFASLEDLEQSSVVQIQGLRDGATDVNSVVQVTSWEMRQYTDQSGEQKSVWGGDVVDPSGSCRLTAWTEVPIDSKSLPVAIRISNARGRSWQGSPDLVVDRVEQVEILDAIPWDTIDPTSHTVEVTFSELLSGSSRKGITSEATVVAVQQGSGIIHRCPTCNKAMRDGSCREHGPQAGVEDLRLRMVLDDGVHNGALILGRDAAETFLNQTMEEVSKSFASDSGEVFRNELRARTIGRRFRFTGRAIIDSEGALIMADSFENSDLEPSESAKAVREKWGVFA